MRSAQGLLSLKPCARVGKTEEDKALNRRVEFELYRPSKEELDKMREEIQEEEEDDW